MHTLELNRIQEAFASTYARGDSGVFGVEIRRRPGQAAVIQVTVDPAASPRDWPPEFEGLAVEVVNGHMSVPAVAVVR